MMPSFRVKFCTLSGRFAPVRPPKSWPPRVLNVKFTHGRPYWSMPGVQCCKYSPVTLNTSLTTRISMTSLAAIVGHSRGDLAVRGEAVFLALADRHPPGDQFVLGVEHLLASVCWARAICGLVVAVVGQDAELERAGLAHLLLDPADFLFVGARDDDFDLPGTVLADREFARARGVDAQRDRPDQLVHVDLLLGGLLFRGLVLVRGGLFLLGGGLRSAWASAGSSSS